MNMINSIDSKISKLRKFATSMTTISVLKNIGVFLLCENEADELRENAL